MSHRKKGNGHDLQKPSRSTSSEELEIIPVSGWLQALHHHFMLCCQNHRSFFWGLKKLSGTYSKPTLPALKHFKTQFIKVHMGPVPTHKRLVDSPLDPFFVGHMPSVHGLAFHLEVKWACINWAGELKGMRFFGEDVDFIMETCGSQFLQMWLSLQFQGCFCSF